MPRKAKRPVHSVAMTDGVGVGGFGPFWAG